MKRNQINDILIVKNVDYCHNILYVVTFDRHNFEMTIYFFIAIQN